MTAPAARSRRMTDGGALIDALRYPFAVNALATNAALTLSQLAVGFIPLVGLVLHVVIWMSAYRYALEMMTASGQGRDEPPQGSMLTDVRSHHANLWLQAVVIIGLVVTANLFGPITATLMLVAAALILPAALLALAAAQNMLAAVNPAAWLAVLRIVGPGYLLLALGMGATLLLQLAGARVFDVVWPALLGDALYFFCVHAALFAVFRLLGTRLHTHAAELGHEQASNVGLPILARDREEQALAREVRDSEALQDPAARAQALAPVIRRGAASDALHAEYRRCLRAAGKRSELGAHAEVRTCELLVLKQPKPALALAAEAFADQADFSLPDAESTTTLMDAAVAAGQLRLASGAACNYRQRFPKRFDGLPLAVRAAVLLADQLRDTAAAEELLTRGAALAGDGPEAAEFTRLLTRLRAGVALGEVKRQPSS